MRKQNLLLIALLIIFLVVGIFAHTIYMNAEDWRGPSRRYHCIYRVSVGGLSGREVVGTTVIMVPIPATKEGKFFTPPVQKKGPYFKNSTEVFDNKTISGNWTTFIAETDKGYMYGFMTNETELEDISFGREFVADYFDIFDPINNGSPILYPIENISEISIVPYGDYTKYASNPMYDTYVYLSDNLEGGETVSFDIKLEANNDPTEWPEEYRGYYTNLLLAKVNDTGYIKVRAILGQVVPWRSDSTSLWSSQYVLDFYGDETSDTVNETLNYTEVA